MSKIKSQIEVDNIQSLIGELKKLLKNKLKIIIGIDGYDGAGKTSIGNAISNNLNINLIDFDDYIKRKGDSFAKFINYKKLKENIKIQDCIIISGVCLLKVLKRCKIEPDIIIYVKRFNQSCTVWQDKDECVTRNGNRTILKNIIEDLEKFHALLGERKKIRKRDFKFRIELISYHKKYLPFKIADIIYKRKENI